MSTNMALLNQIAGRSNSYSDYLKQLAGTGGLEGREASALLAGGFESGGSIKNTIANPLVNTVGSITGNYGLAQPLGYDQYVQVAGGYGPQGLDNLNSVYLDGWNSKNTGESWNTSGGGNYASAAQLAEYDQGIDQLNHGLGRLDSQLGIALGNVGKRYDQRNNELTTNSSVRQ